MGDAARPLALRCAECGFEADAEYCGRAPPFQPGLVYLEDVYLRRDPFTADARPLCLGGQCAACKRIVCCDVGCSLFYARRFCVSCAVANIARFPPELQREIRAADERAQRRRAEQS